MNDDIVLDIIALFSRCFNKSLDKHPDVKEYLYNRYADIPKEIFTYKEVIYRIKHHIDVRPICKVCGSPTLFMHKNGKMYYSDTCSLTCKNKLNGIKAENTKQRIYGKDKLEIYNKVKQTNIEKYGVENVFANKDIQQKIKHTNLDKYLSEYYLSSEDSKEKRKNTCILKYGVNNPFESFEIQTKIKLTCILKYGVDNYMKTDKGRYLLSLINKRPDIIAKRFNTCLQNFGEKTPLANKEIYMKKLNTCKKHNTYKSSNEENMLYELLEKLDDSIIRQYYSNEYPYACDFYLPLYDLYIEYLGSQYHHGRMFLGNEHDIEELNTLDEHTKYVWSILDIKKFNCASENHLNCLMIYPDWHKDWKYYCRSKNINIMNDLLESLFTLIKNKLDK